jgi:hypothetical protein
MHTRTAYAALLATVALTAGCTSTSHDDAKPSTTPTTKPATASPTGPLTLGAPSAWHGDGYAGTTTALTYTQPVTGIPANDGLGVKDGVWAVAEVKVCNSAGSSDITVSQFPWQLGYADGTRIKVTGLNGGDLPKPEFPTDDTTVIAGDCLRGKIPFYVPRTSRPDRIIYAPEGGDSAVWGVPGK